MSGRSTSMPNWSHTNAASSGDSAMFFGDSGSIAGGTMYGGRLPFRPAGTYRSMWNRNASCSCTSGVSRSIVPGFGVEIDVAAPHPALRLIPNVLVHACRLRVVHDDHVPARLELLRVHLVVALPRAPLLLRQVLGIPLKRVVHQLGRVEELLAAEDDLPVRVDADVAHQRNERVEDLRHAAAEGGRGEVEHLQPAQLLRHLADLLDQRPAREMRVVSKRLVPDPDRLKHGFRLSYASDSLSGRRFTSRTDESLYVTSSTVASTIARLRESSLPAGAALACRSTIRRSSSSSNWSRTGPSEAAARRSVATSLTASLRSATSSG